jgi:peptidoglycan hydrolase-like protein with peptidoglycan-binding domain
MSSPYTFGAEPFQGFTEFDEYESFDELGEFGEPEFGDLETFETDFEFEPEEERGGRRIPRMARGRAPARPLARGIGRRGRSPLAMRPRRPGVRPPRGVRPGKPRPRPRIPPRPRRPPFPVILPAYPGYGPQPPADSGPAEGAGSPAGAPSSPAGAASTPGPSNGGACPTVGRFGNWLRTGNQLTVLLDEDDTPIEGGPEAAAGATTAAGPEAGPEAAPGPEGAAAPAAGPGGSADTGAPPEGGEPGGEAGELPFAYESDQEFNQERGPVTWRGPWFRQGRNIVVNLDEPRFGEHEMGEVPLLQKGIAAAAQKAAAQAAKQIAAAKAKKAGMPAEKVCWIQNVLNVTQGESLVADGIFGPKTRAAVTRFQAKNGLKIDGIFGPQTETASIQAALNQIALASVLSVNGVMDAATRQEIIKFQSANNLKVDGIVGRNTRAAMVKALGGACVFPKPKPGPKPPGPKPPGTKPPGTKPPDFIEVPPACDKPELARLVNRCIEDSKRCLINAHQDLGLALLGCAGNPACNAVEMGKYLLALKRCRDALTLCDQDAKRTTKCQ